MRAYIFCLIAVLLAGYSASATIIHIPADYPTIQQGIDASYDGDTVLVKPGEYVENLTVSNRNIVLASHFLTTGDTTYILSTIIDGDSAGTVISVTNIDRSATVTGFTIQNGYSYGFYYGAGITSIGIAVITHNIIKDNHCHVNNDNSGGAGIVCSSTGTIISHNVIIDNIVTDDYSLYGHGAGIYCVNADPVIEYNIISGNSSCWGGGISLRSSSPIIRNNIIWDNTAYP